VVPRLFGNLALLLGVAFALVGFLGLLVSAVNYGIIALLIAQEMWILAAGVTLWSAAGARPPLAKVEGAERSA
jgi:hypothetical protein